MIRSARAEHVQNVSPTFSPAEILQFGSPTFSPLTNYVASLICSDMLGNVLQAIGGQIVV